MSKEVDILKYPLEKDDERGYMFRPIYYSFKDFNIMDENYPLGDVKNLHIVSAEPGVVRGEHFHKEQIEYLVVMGGKIEFRWKLYGSESINEEIIDASQPYLFRVHPNVIHSFKNISDNTIYIICYSKCQPIKEPDSYKINEFHT